MDTSAYSLESLSRYLSEASRRSASEVSEQESLEDGAPERTGGAPGNPSSSSATFAAPNWGTEGTMPSTRKVPLPKRPVVAVPSAIWNSPPVQFTVNSRCLKSETEVSRPTRSS